MMNKQFCYILKSIAVFLCVCLFAACGQSGQITENTEPAASSAPNHSEPSANTDGSGMKAIAPQSQASVRDKLKPDSAAGISSGNPAVLIREDEDGLVQVSIENGEAAVSFDYDRWDELHGIYAHASNYYNADSLADGPFPIGGLSDKVKDACIGKVYQLDYMKYGDFIIPSVMLLMEDQTVEWVLADPLAQLSQVDFDGKLYSMGKLPWLSDIVSFSYEPETAGIGDMTIYAIDNTSLRYDVRLPISFANIFEDEWVCETPLGDGEFPAVYEIAVLFDEGGNLSMTKRWEGDSALSASYDGTYAITLADNHQGGIRPGLITFDLKRNNESDDEVASPAEIHGTYFSQCAEDALSLWISEGDYLHRDPYGEPVGSYMFWTAYHADRGTMGVDTMILSDRELVDFLTSHVPKAYDMVVGTPGGMTALVSGETTMIDELICRDVWLGTDTPGKFTREILYTIDPYGTIYEYDPVVDGWSVVN